MLAMTWIESAIGLTQGVYQVDQSPGLILVLQQEHWNLIDEYGGILRGDGEIVRGT